MFDRKRISCAVLSGVLLTLSFPTPSWFFLAWLAMVPLMFSIESCSYRQSFLLGWFAGFVHFTSLLYWIYYVVNHYGKVPMPLGVITLLLLTSYVALFPGFSCVIYKLLNTRWSFPPGLALSVAWVAGEYARGHLLTGFPWDLIGYSQIPFHTVVQSMDLFGVLGISFLIAFCNGALYSLLKQKRSRMAVVEVLVFVVLFTLNYAYGIHRISEIDEVISRSKPVKVAVIQGNIPQDVKWDKEFQEGTIKRYNVLTEQALEEGHAKLVVWPETAVPFYFGIDIPMSLKVLNIAKNNGIYLIFGAPGLEYHDSKPFYYNWALLASPRGRITGVYAKEHLVPFGEYVPLKKLLFFVHKLAEGVGDFVAGDENQPLFEVDGKKIGALICYEVIFPELALNKCRRGANLLVNISNDAWFGDTSAPYQHLEMAQARAIETRLPLIRCTNTGISAFINVKGEIDGIIPLNRTGYMVKEMRIPHLQSTYVEARDAIAWICVIFPVLVILNALYDKIKKSSNKDV